MKNYYTASRPIHRVQHLFVFLWLLLYVPPTSTTFAAKPTQQQVIPMQGLRPGCCSGMATMRKPVVTTASIPAPGLRPYSPPPSPSPSSFAKPRRGGGMILVNRPPLGPFHVPPPFAFMSPFCDMATTAATDGATAIGQLFCRPDQGNGLFLICSSNFLSFESPQNLFTPLTLDVLAWPGGPRHRAVELRQRLTPTASWQPAFAFLPFLATNPEVPKSSPALPSPLAGDDDGALGWSGWSVGSVGWMVVMVELVWPQRILRGGRGVHERSQDMAGLRGSCLLG
jgi:hypothetical protein